MKRLLAGLLLAIALPAFGQIGPGGGGTACTANCTFTGLTTTAAVSAGGTVSVSAGAGVTNALTVSNNGSITTTITPAGALSTPTLAGTTSVTTPLLIGTTTQSFRSQAASTDGATVTNNLWTFNGAITGTSETLTGALTITGTTSPETITSGGANVFSVVNTGCGALVAGSPCVTVGAGSGNSSGWSLGIASTGISNIWPTVAGASTASNYTLLSNGSIARLNSTGTVGLAINGSEFLTINTTQMLPSFAALTIGSSSLPFGAVFSNGAASLGSIVANTNGVAAAITDVGYVTSGAVLTASAVSLGTGTVTSGASVNLPAGDWDLSATYCYLPTGTTTLNIITLGLNTTAAGIQPGADTGAFVQYVQAATSVPGANDICMTVGPLAVRPTVSNTSYSVISTATFGTSTLKAHGFIRARRMR